MDILLAKDIIFVTISMRGGGTERVIATLSNYYVTKGINVHILMISESTVEYELDDRINVRQIATTTGGSLLGRVNRISSLRKEISAKKDATVIAMGTVAAMFTVVSMVGLKNRLIISERNNPDILNHRPIKSYEKFIRNLLYQKADKLVFQTKMARDCFPSKYHEKSVIILNPISKNLPKFSENEVRDKTVVTAGRLTKQKNHEMLIRTFVEFHNEYPEYELNIYGEGELKAELGRIINELDASAYIHLCGQTDSLYDILKKTQIYVSTSNWEGISNSVMEAMAMGTAVIATDCPMGGNAVLINNMENGILIPVEDKKMLYKNLILLAEDQELRMTLGNRATMIRSIADTSKIAMEWLQ